MSFIQEQVDFSFEIFFRGWIPFIEEEKRIILILSSIAAFVLLIFGHLNTDTISLALIVIILFRKFFAGGFCENNKRLDGQLIIITGSNTGIGKETAKELASRGAKLILACRDVKKAENVASEIKSQYSTEVKVEKLNLASFKSIKSFADIIKQNYKEIHCLINNAGVMMCPYMETEDGLEMQMGVNHFGHFLLTLHLLPLLLKGHEARIINVSSTAHFVANAAFENFGNKKEYNRVTSYGNSKLANILHIRYLSKLLKETNVQVFSLHPGAVESDLGRHFPLGLDIVYSRLLSFFAKTTREGMQTTVYCATEANQQTTFFYRDSKPSKPSKHALNDEKAEKLWKMSEKIVDFSYTQSLSK